MKTFLRNKYIQYILIISLSVYSVNANAQVYTTRTNGNWLNPATWVNGLIPPDGLILVTATININHNVTYNGLLNIQNFGTIKLINTTGTIPVLTIPSGKNLENESSGKIYIKNAEYRQYRFAGGGNSGTAQTGDFINDGGYIEINNSIVEVATNFINKGGVRSFKKGVILTGGDYELKQASGIDTLDKVSVSVGWCNNGEFKLSDGKIYFNQAKIQLAGSNSKFTFNSGQGCGDIDYITFKNNVTSVVGTGDLSVASSVNTSTGLNLDAYCVSAASKYKTNGKFSGSQSFDCSLNYFPSTFMIQQTNNLSSGLSFTSPQPIGTASLAVGAKYRFLNVNDSTDAIVVIDSLINGATVTTIDDNTIGTGYPFAFQPKVASGNLIGRSYAVFSIKFYKANTYTATFAGTPVSIQHINATPLDIDGNATLKEFAEVSMGEGSQMSYMSSTIDIGLLSLLPGNFGAQNILGIERDNIDTASYNNMFTVANTDMSSFTIKYGTYTTTPTTSSRQFSLYMRGFSYNNYALLPVNLMSFTAILNKDNKVDLKWSSATEQNLSHYIVEKSTDGINFSEAGMVFAYGNTTERSDYNMTDVLNNLSSGVVYYRLRSMDNDGKGQLSETRIIRISKSDANNISILTYPNPVSNDLRITVPANWQNRKLVYEVITMNGQVVKRTESANSSQTETINVSALAPGAYVVRVSFEGQTAQQKIIKH